MISDFVGTAKAAELSDRHVVTIRRALDSGELHGHQRVRRGTWSISPLAIRAWILGIDQKSACGCRPSSVVRLAS
jgi:hypothetical protein